MQIYAIKMQYFFRFGDKNNSVVFDLTDDQKKSIANKETTLDEIYNEFGKDPVAHIAVAKANGIEPEIGIIGMIDGDTNSSNGAGKSTILDAICYSLYEKVVRKTANTTKIEKAGLSVATKIDGKYPDKMTESYVEAYGEENGVIFRVKRGRSFSGSKKTHSPILEFEIYNEKDIVKRMGHRTTDTNKSIEDVLMMDYDGFVNSLMFGQNDAGKFLMGTDKIKKEMIINILRLNDLVNGCLNIVRKNKNEQDKKVSILKSNIDIVHDMLMDEIRKYVDNPTDISLYPNAISNIDAIISKCEKDIVEFDVSIEGKRKELNALHIDVIKDKFARILEQGKQIRKHIKDIEADKEKAISDTNKALEKCNGTIEELSIDTDKKRKTVSTYNDQLSKTETDLKAINVEEINEKLKKIASYKAKQADIEKILSNLNTDREKLLEQQSVSNSDISRHSKDIADLKSQLSSIDGQDFKCSKCKSIVSRHHIESEIKLLETIVQDLKKDLDECSEKIKSVNADIVKQKENLGKIEKAKQIEIKLNNDISNVDALKNRKTELSNMISEANKEIDVFVEKEKMENEQKTALEERVKTESVDFDKKISEKLVEIEQKQAEYKEAEAKMESLGEKSKVIEDVIKDISEQQKALSGKIGELKKSIESINSIKEKLDAHSDSFLIENKILSRYIVLDNIFGLGGIQTKIIDKYLPLMNIYVQEYMEILSGGAISVNIYINDKSQIDMDLLGASADSYEMLSGGEKMIVRLAVDIGMALLAFSRTSQTPEMICLDEIFGPLDKKHTDGVFDMLKALHDKFKRVLVITHNPLIQQQLKSNLMVEKGFGPLGLSEIKYIE